MSPLVLAKHAAEARIREAFQGKYGRFWKCSKCGLYAEYDACEKGDRCPRCWGQGKMELRGYSEPADPEEDTPDELACLSHDTSETA